LSYHFNRYEKALENYHKDVQITLKVFGEMHPDVAASYNNIGMVYKNLGKYILFDCACVFNIFMK
jgi:hypothetical protein